MNFNESTRVKIPAILHLCRLGYVYRPLTTLSLSEKTNIDKVTFIRKFDELNPGLDPSEGLKMLNKVESVLNNDDLGREFYDMLSSVSGFKLIDFTYPKNNDFYCVTELTCADKETGEEFRPDITLFVNGLPLALIEVKKPNNTDGIQAEQARMVCRNGKKSFRRFLNLSQLLIFSNNQEYTLLRGEPFLGAYYATRAAKRPIFNCFHEPTFGSSASDPDFIRDFRYQEVTHESECNILSDNNCEVIIHDPEYDTNKKVGTPTNRLITSLCSKERFLWMLRYAFAYVDVEKELENGEKIRDLQKHIMRYQQVFATMGIKKRLELGDDIGNKKSGIIWHTQGSGKTALAYFNIRHLADYYAQKNIVPKFYFIVDRLDLLEQATTEFLERGLVVTTANSKAELIQQFRTQTSVTNASGKLEIVVVNIQKFKEDHDKVDEVTGYDTRLQRIYFIDEAHRGYAFDGSFLCNLLNSDKNAVKIALTGTPLIGEEKKSCRVFGSYIDTYYYNQSIRDGYTLKLMREDIESNYRLQIQKILEEIKVKKSDIPHDEIIQSNKYCSALLDYITNDLKKCRLRFGNMGTPDNSIAGMIVCETNPQARMMFDLMTQDTKTYGLKAVLILHDEDDKEFRKKEIACFKKEQSIDLLIVNNMLLTGFDAPRLKKLYLGRKIKDHNLLQALTRVNRRYKNFEYGYIVDFADIRENFDTTNAAYLHELEEEVGKENMEGISDLFENDAEIINKMEDIREILFNYETDNVEVFHQQIDAVEDKAELLKIKRGLESARSLANVVSIFGGDDLKSRFAAVSIEKATKLYGEICRRIAAKNVLDSADTKADVAGLISAAMATLEFRFVKKGEEELRMATNDFQDKCTMVQDEFSKNFDHAAEDYISLMDSFRSYFKRKGWIPSDVADAKEKIGYLDDVLGKIREINRRNNLLKEKYNRDEKFARIHKRIGERAKKEAHPIISAREMEICNTLSALKCRIDERVLLSNGILRNDPFFKQTVMQLIGAGLVDLKIDVTLEDKQFITTQIAGEYLRQYHEQFAA
jgi:type I restriction enzyme, R subunit